MKMNPLGRTGIKVSELCLGTMTFSTQTPESDAHIQIDTALDHGVNFIDTAEMYPTNPLRAETTGNTERVIGNWFEKTGRRKDVVLATKHSGEGYMGVRNGAPITAKSIPKVIEGNLRRLKTDYIDLYQFHWPNRGSYMFRQNWTYDPSTQNRQETLDNMSECLESLQSLVDQGKIRAFGLSNESAWGTAQWLRISEDRGLPRVATVQNEYSLLCRLYDTDMAELSHNEDVGLLAFSPLAAGYLTGKYQGGKLPAASRKTFQAAMGGRETARVRPAVAAYHAIAQRHGVDPVHLALAFCTSRPFMASVIFGATTQAQLELLLAGIGLVLSDEILAEIDVAHRAHPMPY
ncbi:MAG: aldo/keto reductase [Paracoccaceae bacterium]|nr:aldo/keto reductase [Paracoccaceae bacterium]MDP7185850.1 aldo/keto reductase [Paracoccaceae bacterium]